LDKISKKAEKMIEEGNEWIKQGIPTSSMKQRKSWHQYFMDICNSVSERGTCDRKRVGCVLVKDNRILATGYNGSAGRTKHCDEIGHLMEEGHCIRTVHAEINTLAQCAKHGISCDGATAFINTFPCFNCFKALVNAGIVFIYYQSDYDAKGKNHVIDLAKELGISMVKI